MVTVQQRWATDVWPSSAFGVAARSMIEMRPAAAVGRVPPVLTGGAAVREHVVPRTADWLPAAGRGVRSARP